MNNLSNETNRNILRQTVFQISQKNIGAVITDEFGGAGIEIQSSGQGQCSRQFRRCDKAVSGGVGVVTGSEVAVVRGDDRVLFALLHVLTIPLTDARSAGVGQNGSSELAQCLHVQSNRIQLRSYSIPVVYRTTAR